MKKAFTLPTIFATALIAFAENPREVFWENAVAEINEKPQSAIGTFDDLIARTAEAQAWDEYVLATILRSRALAKIEGRNKNAAIVRSLQAASKKSANTEARAFIDAQLSRALENFASEMNYGRMTAETQIANAEKNATTDPVETWSRERMLREADSAFQRIFADAETLKKIPITPFLTKKIESETLKKHLQNAGMNENEFGLITLNDSTTAEFPTLFDFFAQDSINFYSRSQDLRERFDLPENAFSQLPNDPALFASTEEFLQYVPATKDNDAPLLRQLKILQAWEKFHQNDAEKSALARTKLTRILWAFENSEKSPEISNILKTSLKNFANEFSYFPIAAEAEAARAQRWLDEDENPQAHLIARAAYKKYKDKPNAHALAKILDELERKDIGNFRSDYVWANQDSATIKFSAKNVSKVYLRAVRWDWNDFLKRERNRPKNLSTQEQKEILLAKENALEWTHEIDSHNDFKRHEYSVPAPLDKLAPGFYFIVVSAREDFSFKNNDIAYQTAWVSNLALISDSKPLGKNATNKTQNFAGRVVNAITGEPIEGANITVWNRVYGGARVALPSVKTDADGKFSVSNAKENFIALAETDGGNAIDSEGNSARYYSNSYAQENDTSCNKIFTDRAIYRPGQNIQFKGILAEYNAREFASEKVLPGKKITVKLFDVNDREIEKIDCYTNAFGSFAGTFSTPVNTLPGTYKIAFEKTEKQIQIEEYKRPKIEAKITVPAEEMILGGNANFTISAKSLTGTPLNGAKVEWQVETQKTHFLSTKETPEIHGTGTLDNSGNLKISFPTEVAKLDPTSAKKLSAEECLKEERKLSKTFLISANVTDSNGETHTISSRLNIGNSAIKADVFLEKNLITESDSAQVCVNIRTVAGKEINGVPAQIQVFKCALPEKISEESLTSQTESIPRGEKIFEKSIKSRGEKNAQKHETLPQFSAGAYIVAISGKDAFGKPFENQTLLRVVDTAGTKFPIREAFFCEAFPSEKKTAHPISTRNAYEVGEDCKIVWGSGYKTARAYVEIFYKGKLKNAFWTDAGKTQQIISVPVTAELAGGFDIRVSQVRDNNFSTQKIAIHVAVPDKELKISWEKFRTNLIPGGAEIWTAKISAPNNVPAKAEMVATLYDASLNLFRENYFSTFSLPEYIYSGDIGSLSMENTVKWSRGISNLLWKSPYSNGKKNDFYKLDWNLENSTEMLSLGFGGYVQSAKMSLAGNFADAEALPTRERKSADSVANYEVARTSPSAEIPFAAPRKNLQETAFFYPFLNTDANGVVTISFVVPEALTTWRFLAFAHDEKLRSGVLVADNIITSKDLMVQPNAPRFLREGDEIFFPVKITNSGKTDLAGTAKLAFANLETSADMSAQLGIAGGQEFSVPANTSKTLLWKIRVPADCPFLSYRATATAGTLSDGEENFLPVLSKKITITESVNVPVRGNAKKEITFEKLRAGTDSSLISRAFSIRANSNPGIDVLLALPSLEEKCNENESSDSIFFRYYTNALAEKIATSGPELQNLFKRWRETPALESPLAKNTELKQLALEETPYWNDAQDETAQRRAIGKFFDKNRVEFEKTRALNELRERLEACHGNGWSWFPGRDEANDSITLNIVCGFARLRQMGIETDMSLPMRAIPAQDKWLGKRFDNFDDDGKRVPAGIDSLLAGYLYTRSFYQKEIPQSRKDAWEYYLAQAKNPESWLALPRMSQAHIALALFQVGGDENISVAKRIAESIKQHATQTEELGAFWKDERTLPWWRWNYAPTETQAMMVELFERVAGDNAFAEEIRINLLTQKQATIWKSTRATADAIWAISAGKDKRNTGIVSAQPLNISTGTQKVELEQTASLSIDGTREKTFIGSEIVPTLGKISIENPNKTIAWASASWTFSQDIDTVSAHEQSAMKIRKTLWKKSLRPDGTSALFPARGEILEPGDELLVRLTIETDRDFDFVHMKDYRGSGTEPANTLSGYRWNNGVWYYEATRDTGTHFFFDKLPAGTHVFEYSLRIQQRGKYTGGITELRSLYAPEFNAHSSATKITAR